MIMKRIPLIIAFLSISLVSTSFAKSSCKQLYDDLNEVLEPQMTQLCQDARDSSILLFDFYILDENEEYTQMELAYLPPEGHLFIEGDENPYKCGDQKENKFQDNSEILQMLFLIKDCEEGFKESIGLE